MGCGKLYLEIGMVGTRIVKVQPVIATLNACRVVLEDMNPSEES